MNRTTTALLFLLTAVPCAIAEERVQDESILELKIEVPSIRGITLETHLAWIEGWIAGRYPAQANIVISVPIEIQLRQLGSSVRGTTDLGDLLAKLFCTPTFPGPSASTKPGLRKQFTSS